MEITIIGSGNVAAALAGAVAGQDSLHLKQLCARNPLRGRELADRYGAEYIARPEETAEADLYLIAVSDSAVEEVSARLRTPPGATVAHTSGGLGIDSLRVRRRPGRMLSAANLFGGTQHRFPHRPPLHRIHHRPGRPHRPGLRGGALRLCPRSRQRPTWQTPRSGSLRM